MFRDKCTISWVCAIFYKSDTSLSRARIRKIFHISADLLLFGASQAALKNFIYLGASPGMFLYTYGHVPETIECGFLF